MTNPIKTNMHAYYVEAKYLLWKFVMIWLLHTKKKYFKSYLHCQHCEFAYVIRYEYKYFEGCWHVPLKTWKIYFLRKCFEKLILKEITLKNITVKVYLSHRMREFIFFTLDINKLKRNLSIDIKILICIMILLIS